MKFEYLKTAPDEGVSTLTNSCLRFILVNNVQRITLDAIHLIRVIIEDAARYTRIWLAN